MNNKNWPDVYKTLILRKDELDSLEKLIDKALGEGLMDEKDSDNLAEISIRIDELIDEL